MPQEKGLRSYSQRLKPPGSPNYEESMAMVVRWRQILQFNAWVFIPTFISQKQTTKKNFKWADREKGLS